MLQINVSLFIMLQIIVSFLIVATEVKRLCIVEDVVRGWSDQLGGAINDSISLPTSKSSILASLLNKKRPVRTNEVSDVAFHQLHNFPLPVFPVFMLIFSMGRK